MKTLAELNALLSDKKLDELAAELGLVKETVVWLDAAKDRAKVFALLNFLAKLPHDLLEPLLLFKDTEGLSLAKLVMQKRDQVIALEFIKFIKARLENKELWPILTSLLAEQAAEMAYLTSFKGVNMKPSGMDLAAISFLKIKLELIFLYLSCLDSLAEDAAYIPHIIDILKLRGKDGRTIVHEIGEFDKTWHGEFSNENLHKAFLQLLKKIASESDYSIAVVEVLSIQEKIHTVTPLVMVLHRQPPGIACAYIEFLIKISSDRSTAIAISNMLKVKDSYGDTLGHYSFAHKGDLLESYLKLLLFLSTIAPASVVNSLLIKNKWDKAIVNYVAWNRKEISHWEVRLSHNNLALYLKLLKLLATTEAKAVMESLDIGLPIGPLFTEVGLKFSTDYLELLRIVVEADSSLIPVVIEILKFQDMDRLDKLAYLDLLQGIADSNPRLIPQLTDFLHQKCLDGRNVIEHIAFLSISCHKDFLLFLKKLPIVWQAEFINQGVLKSLASSITYDKTDRGLFMSYVLSDSYPGLDLSYVENKPRINSEILNYLESNTLSAEEKYKILDRILHGSDHLYKIFHYSTLFSPEELKRQELANLTKARDLYSQMRKIIQVKELARRAVAGAGSDSDSTESTASTTTAAWGTVLGLFSAKKDKILKELEDAAFLESVDNSYPGTELFNTIVNDSL